MKNNVIYLLTLMLVVSILIISCRKDFGNYINQDQISENLLEDAKIFYTKKATLSTFPNLQRGKLMSAERVKSNIGAKAFIKLKPIWKNSFSIQNQIEELIVVPTVQNKLENESVEISRFFVFHKKGGEIFRGEIIELINQDVGKDIEINDVIRDYDKEQNNNFTGGVLIYDLNYFYIKSVFFMNGHRNTNQGVIIPVATSNRSSGQVTTQTDSGGSNCQAYYLYITYYYSDGSTSQDSFYLGNVCSGPSPECTADCSNYNGGGGGTGYGGNSGPSTVVNSCVTPCAKAAVDVSLYNGQPNDIRSLFLSRFSQVPNSSVTFTEITLPADDIREARTTYNTNNPLNYTVELNMTTFLTRSREYNFATISHEMLHAYLRTYFTEAADGSILVPSQHETMIQEYISKLTFSLKSQFIEMDVEDARALALGGLEGTSIYNSYSETEKKRIKQIQAQYADTENYGSKGHYCN